MEGTARAEVWVRLAHPAEGANLPAVNSSFVYGAASTGTRVQVNGEEAAVYPNGAFLAMIPYLPGRRTIIAEAYSSAGSSLVVRHVSIAAPLAATTTRAVRLEEDLMRPAGDLEVLPGDLVYVQVKGTPGCEARFSIQGVARRLPMTERDGLLRGVYAGAYQVQPGDEVTRTPVEFTLSGKRGGRARLRAKGRVTVLDPRVPRVVELVEEAVVRSGPGQEGDRLGYDLVLSSGIRARVTGRDGHEVRLRLSGAESGWTDARSVKPLPVGTPPPRATIGTVETRSSGRGTLVTLHGGGGVPYRVEVSSDLTSVTLMLYGAVSNTDWMHYDSADDVVRELRWRQREPDVYELTARLKGPCWGYDVRSDRHVVVLEIRRPPAGLDGLVVAVDAGHGAPGSGATGPTGVGEPEVTLEMARAVKAALEGAGAKVVMTRDGPGDVPLAERPKIAWRAGADLLISLHANALAEGGNPFEKHGFGVYYREPQSLGLASAVHRAGRSLGLRDDGLHYGNLALCRVPQMPAVLVEAAYLIYPPEETLLTDPTFHSRLARVLVSAIRASLPEK